MTSPGEKTQLRTQLTLFLIDELEETPIDSVKHNPVKE